MWTFKTVNLSLIEWLLDTPNLSLMSNPSFMTKSLSSTVKESVVLTFWCTYTMLHRMLKDGTSKDVTYARNTESGCNVVEYVWWISSFVTACTWTCSLAQIASPVKITVYLQVNPDFQTWESSKSLQLKFFFSLQIMEAMALHLESSYEKLYRWSQGMMFAVACVAGRRKGRKVKMSAGGRRNGLQGHYCFLCFFRPPDECKNCDWSDLMNNLIHPSDWSATCHSNHRLRSLHIYIQQGG